MAPIKNNRIFPNSTRTARARESATRAAEILQKMQQSLRYPTQQTTRDLEFQSARLSSALRGIGGLIPVERQLVRMAENIQRLSRTQQNSLVNQVLSSMGSPGQLISSWLRGREGSQSLTPIKDEIQNAMNLLGQFSGSLVDTPLTPEQAGGNRLPDWSEGAGSPVPPRPPSSSAGSRGGSGDRGRDGGSGNGRNNRLPPDDAGPHRNVRILPNGDWEIRAPGYHRILNQDDPVLTGRMQLVTKSSNVHSIGFDFNFDLPLKSKLIIRYKQKNRKTGSGQVGGPTYEYISVHPDWFTDLVNFDSKGKWVWDQLRIRGSVAGHQYPYNLIRAAQGYLPRRAMVRKGIQRLVQRERLTERGDMLRSPLPNQTLGRYSPSAHRPNVGNMDRGRLERGTPNRGR